MTTETPDRRIRELDRRTGDGIDVRLLWNSMTDQVVLTVHDQHTDESFELPVAPADAAFAFRHPYAYAGFPPAADLLAA